MQNPKKIFTQRNASSQTQAKDPSRSANGCEPDRSRQPELRRVPEYTDVLNANKDVQNASFQYKYKVIGFQDGQELRRSQTGVQEEPARLRPPPRSTKASFC